MIGHAGGLGWDELVLWSVVIVFLVVLLVRGSSRSGGDEEEPSRPAGPCPYCGRMLEPGDTTCPACGFRVRRPAPNGTDRR